MNKARGAPAPAGNRKDGMMSAYFLFDVREIKDPDGAAAYRARVFDTVAQYQGRYLVLGGPVEAIEGDWQPAIPVIIEFPSLETAREWYDSDAYRPLRALRLAATVSHAVLLPGFDAGPADG